jgi:EAL domain-containing protein (putative c-di-GMP-specific phosphodiesterase class I)/GGDEF domain-containing protein
MTIMERPIVRVPEPVLVVAPRYGDEVAAMVTAAGHDPRIERLAADAAARFAREAVRLAVVDARGALVAGMAAAQALGPMVEGRHGAMLVLLSRGDAKAAAAASEAGATSVLVSPFGSDSFANALHLAGRQAARLAAAAGPMAATPGEGVAIDRSTGLPGEIALEHWLASRLEAGQPAGLILVGISRLAQISTLHGRALADRLMLAITRRLGVIVAGIDGFDAVLARGGPAEFALGLAGNRAGTALDGIARQLLAACEGPFAVEERLIHVAGRAGIAFEPALTTAGPAAQAAALLREAGIALADAQGREAGSVARFEPEQDREALARRADLESDLFQAIKTGDIALLFQPQADLGNGHIIGAEALVRWDHPVHGRLSAATLLETAARLDLAVELGCHIRARAIALAAGWRGALAGLKLSINVTAADLADPQFIDTLARDLARAGLDPRRLVVEVTEDAIINDMDAAAATLSLLRRDGVGIALDDFGAGYSSLARLARLPVDLIKLDRVFAQCLNGSRRERIVVEGMITTACRLGLTVIAEGIEDDVQLDAARVAGCHVVQGYRVAPPLDADALAVFCQQRQSDVA